MLLAVSLTACKQSLASTESEAELAAQRMERLYQDYAQDAKQRLEQIVSHNPDSTYADRMAARYHREGGAWLWTGRPDQLELGCALDSVLRREAPAMGFGKDAFFIDEIGRGLADMQQPDSASNVAQTMATLEDKLTKAYLRYAVGQRFGFTTPTLLFGKNNYDIEIEQADSAFVSQALQQLGSRQTMLDFLASVEPEDSAYHALKAQLAKDTTDAARQRTLCNMERLRWRNKKHPENANRYIFVNVAAQELWAIGPDSVNQMRICCGKTSTKSPLLTSEIHLVQVNPEWGIPQSIIRGEVSHRAGDSAYFARNRYYITDRQGQRVDPKSVTTEQLRSGQYAVRQRSGAGNSLGRIIFRFANRFSVYLHDTSSPGAFNRDVRTVSHGCIRLQRPFEIAEFVLPEADEWLLEKIRLSMDLKPRTEKGKEYRKTHEGAIRLISSTPVAPKVPVLIDYYTLYPNPKTGVVEAYGDPYGYDKILEKAIKPFLH